MNIFVLIESESK